MIPVIGVVRVSLSPIANDLVASFSQATLHAAPTLNATPISTPEQGKLLVARAQEENTRVILDVVDQSIERSIKLREEAKQRQAERAIEDERNKAASEERARREAAAEAAAQQRRALAVEAEKHAQEREAIVFTTIAEDSARRRAAVSLVA